MGATMPNSTSTQVEPALDVVGSIIAWEQGSLDYDATLRLFQHLVDTGLAWELQGVYGRTARYMLDTGLIRPAGGL